MATLYIALRQNTEQRASEQELTLDGVRVRFRALYNAGTDRWYLDILDLEGALIVGSIALMPGVDLLLPFKHLPIPQGELFVRDEQNRLPGTLTTQDVSSLLIYREVA